MFVFDLILRWLWGLPGVIGVLLLLLNSGCSVMDTGPFTVGKIMGGVQTIATQLVSKMDVKQITADADGKVNNPEFQIEGAVGPVWYFKTNVRLIGAEASFDVDAAGTGGGQDEFSMLWEAWQDAGRPDDFKTWITGVAEAIRGPMTTQPAETDDG